MILDLLYIAIIIVFIIDYAGFFTTIEDILSKMISRIRQKNIHITIPRPFSCSLCMVFWSGLIYILATGNLSLYSVMIVSLFSASSIILSEIMDFTRDIIIKIIYALRKLFKI